MQLRLIFPLIAGWLITGAATAQSLPTAALQDSFFAGGEYSPSSAPNQLRLRVDGSGNRYLLTNSFGLVSMVPHQGTTYGNFASVRKLSPEHRELWLYRQTQQTLTGLALASDGSVYISGWEENQKGDGFIRKLTPDGQVVWQFPIEGRPAGLAMTPEGDLLLAGIPNESFRTTRGAFRSDPSLPSCSNKYATVFFPCQDVFVMRVQPSSQQVVYATYLGGNRGETPWDIAAGTDGSAYVVGETLSPDFPTTSGAVQTTYGGTVNFGPLEFGDGFVTRLSPAGDKILYSTYAGFSGPDVLYSVAVGSNGDVLAGGKTQGLGTMPGLESDALFVSLTSTGVGAVSTQQFLHQRAAVNAIAISSSGRYFVSAEFLGVTPVQAMLEELDAKTLRPVRAVADRQGSLATLAAAGPGAVQSASYGFLGLQKDFAVPPSAGTAGSIYWATWNFDRDPEPWIGSLVNAASNLPGQRFGGLPVSVAPSEIVTIYGGGLSEAKVFFDSVPATVLYRSPGQLNVLVPSSLVPGLIELRIEVGQKILGPYRTEVAPVVPALFTLPTNGQQSFLDAAALNHDGTVNTASNPASPGSVVALFGTGLGATDPQDVSKLINHLQVFGPGGPGGGMEVLYAGSAPNLPGVQQVNVRIHPDILSASTSRPALIKVVFDFGILFQPTQDNVRIYVK